MDFQGSVIGIKYANNSHKLLIGSEEGKICIWNYNDLKCAANYIDISKTLFENRNEVEINRLIVTAVEWNTDDTLITIAITVFSDETMIKVFNAINCSLVHVLIVNEFIYLNLSLYI